MEGVSAVDHSTRGKCSKYEGRCAAQEIPLLPLPVDIQGGWHLAAPDTINRGGRWPGMWKGGPEVVRHLRQRLAVLMVRNNFAMLCARTPTHPPPGGWGGLSTMQGLTYHLLGLLLLRPSHSLLLGILLLVVPCLYRIKLMCDITSHLYSSLCI